MGDATNAWWLIDDPALPPTARDVLADPGNEPLVSTASIWEIAIKRTLGTLSVADDLPDRVSEEAFVSLPVTAAHAWRVRELPAHHRDPFDRLLVAPALEEQVPVLTIDERFAAYGVDVTW